MKTKYRNRKQPTKKKARKKNKTLKQKQSRRTLRLKRRSSKRRGGVRPSTTEALMKVLNQLEGDPSLHPLFIDTAYNAFIINPKAIVKVDREGHWDEVTNYILDKFTEFSTNPDLIKIIKEENEYLIDMLDSREFIALRQNRHPNHVNLARRYDIFVSRLFEIAPVPL